MSTGPFKLFEPYTVNDKNLYFGREAETFALYNLLQQTRLVLFYGASGTGKTSIIQAGLPKVFKLTDWFRVHVRRRDNINDSLRAELGKFSESDVTTIEKAVTAIYEDRWMPIFLIFDQFEEIFTLGSHEERLAFFKDIQHLLDKPLPCKIIFSMREEYIGHLYEYEPIVPALFDKRFRVEAMKDGTIQKVLEEMVREYTAAEQRAAIVKKIFEQLKEGKQAVHLPYMQVYLYYLYEHSAQTTGKVRFTEQGIEEIGKLGNVLKRFIETISSEAQTEFTQWGLPSTFAADLLDEFATDQGTKRAGKVAEIALKLDTTEENVKQALKHFTEKKLLRADEDDTQRYEPVHDAVAKQIFELRPVENKEFNAFLSYLQTNYELWRKEAENVDRLLVENDVAKAEIYKDRLKKRPEFAEKWEKYIEQSRERNKRKLEEAIKEAEAKEAQNQKLQLALEEAQVAKMDAEREKENAETQAQIADRAKLEADKQRQEAEIQKNKSKRNSKIAWIVAGVAVVASILAYWAYRSANAANELANSNLRKFQETEINTYLSDAETFQKSGDKKEAATALDSACSITERYFKKDMKYDSLINEIKKREQKQLANR